MQFGQIKINSLDGLSDMGAGKGEGALPWEGAWGRIVEGPGDESQFTVSYSTLGHTGVSYWILVMEENVCILLMWGKEKHLLSDYYVPTLLGIFIGMSHIHAFWKKVLFISILQIKRQSLKEIQWLSRNVNWYLVQARFEFESVWLYSGGFPLPIFLLCLS